MTVLDRPPADWKRPALPVSVRIQVILNQQGLCAETGERILLVGDCRFDHRPALWERRFDTTVWDTIPPANDPDHIHAVSLKGHDVRTHGPGGERRVTTANSDSGRRAKLNRLTEQQKAFRKRVLARSDTEPHDGAQPTRSWRWPSRSIASRSFDGPGKK